MALKIHWCALAIEDALAAMSTHEGNDYEKMQAALNAASNAQGLNGRKRRHYKRERMYYDVMPKDDQLNLYRIIVREELARFDMTWDMLIYGGQMRPVVDCRWKIIWRVRLETNMSFPAIGKLLEIDHSTAVNAFQRMEETNGMYYAQRPASFLCLRKNREKLKKIDERIEAMAA